MSLPHHCPLLTPTSHSVLKSLTTRVIQPILLVTRGDLTRPTPRLVDLVNLPSMSRPEANPFVDDRPMLQKCRMFRTLTLRPRLTDGSSSPQGTATISILYSCRWEGCPYSGTFNRESSLIRHLRNMHIAPRAHPCPMPDCNRICNRTDTLRQHLHAFHNVG